MVLGKYKISPILSLWTWINKYLSSVWNENKASFKSLQALYSDSASELIEFINSLNTHDASKNHFASLEKDAISETLRF